MFNVQTLPIAPARRSAAAAPQHKPLQRGAAALTWASGEPWAATKPKKAGPLRTVQASAQRHVTATSAQRAPRGAGQRGFTIIELVIGLVVVAILAALAFPAFFDAVRKGRRSDAFAALTSLQLAQERWRANSTSYTTKIVDDLKLKETLASGHYTLSVTEASESTYTLQATATGQQAKDTRCATMTLRVAAGNVQYGSVCATCTPTSPPTDPGRCWSR